MIRLSRLQISVPIVDDQGRPSSGFTRSINDILTQIEAAINGSATAQAAADAAQDQAITALAAAVAAATAAGNAQTTANNAVIKDVGPAWANATGTALRTAFATYAAPAISNPPTQAEVQALANAAQTIAQHMKAAIDDLIGNGALT